MADHSKVFPRWQYDNPINVAKLKTQLGSQKASKEKYSSVSQMSTSHEQHTYKSIYAWHRCNLSTNYNTFTI